MVKSQAILGGRSSSLAIVAAVMAVSLCAAGEASTQTTILALQQTPGLAQSNEREALAIWLGQLGNAARHLGLLRDGDWRGQLATPAILPPGQRGIAAALAVTYPSASEALAPVAVAPMRPHLTNLPPPFVH